MNWSDDGSFLLSGSDDLSLVIWSARSGNRKYHVAHNIETSHFDNILDAKFAPGIQRRIISTSAYGDVEVVEDWPNYHGKDSPTQKFQASVTGESARSIEFVDSRGDVFLVCCGDGRIVQFDLRQRSSHQPKTIIDFSKPQLSLYSISICPFASQLLAVGSCDPFVRFYDRRMLRGNSPAYYWIPVTSYSKAGTFVTGVRFSRYSYDLAVNVLNDGVHLINPIYQNDSQTSKILLPKPRKLPDEALWNQVFRDYNQNKYRDAADTLLLLIRKHTKLRLHECWAHVLGLEIYNHVLATVQLRAPERRFLYSGVLEELDVAASFAGLSSARYLACLYLFCEERFEEGRVLCRKYTRRLASPSSDEWIEKIRDLEAIASVCELDPAQIPHLIPNSFAKVCSSMPFFDIASQQKVLELTDGSLWGFNGSLGHYTGPVLEETIKGVSFLGSDDEYIGVGSDSGHTFIYKNPSKFKTMHQIREEDEQQEMPVWLVKSDRNVVNVVEGHPKQPCVAVSGIDDTIKIWKPCDLDMDETDLAHEVYSAVPTIAIPSTINQMRDNQRGPVDLQAVVDFL